MRKRIPLTILAVGILAAGVVAPTVAQTNVDSGLLDTVKAAFDTTKAVSSVTVSSQSTNGDSAQANGAPSRMTTQSDQLSANSAGWDVSGTRTTTSTGGQDSVVQTTTLEYIEVNGTTYVRFTAIPDRMAQMGLPTDWVDASTLGQIPGVNIGADGTISVTALETLALPLDASSVTAISELPVDTLNGQNMHVYQLTLDANSVASSDAAGLLNVGRGFGGPGFGGNGQQAPGGQPNGQQPPANNQQGNGQQPPSGQPPTGNNGQQPPGGQSPNGNNDQQSGGFQPQFSADNLQVTVTVWVGDDGLVYRVSSDVSAAASSDANANANPMANGFDLTTVTDFSQFNVPVQISAPTTAGA